MILPKCRYQPTTAQQQQFADQEADFVKAHTSEITLLPCGVRKYQFSLFVREIGVTVILNVKNIDFSTAGLWSKGTWLPEVTNFSIQATEKNC